MAQVANRMQAMWKTLSALAAAAFFAAAVALFLSSTPEVIASTSQLKSDRADALEWFQPDRIHPLAKAHPQMLDNVWPALKALL